jgi:hypothetical protein
MRSESDILAVAHNYPIKTLWGALSRNWRIRDLYEDLTMRFKVRGGSRDAFKSR